MFQTIHTAEEKERGLGRYNMENREYAGYLMNRKRLLVRMEKDKGENERQRLVWNTKKNNLPLFDTYHKYSWSFLPLVKVSSFSKD